MFDFYFCYPVDRTWKRGYLFFIHCNYTISLIKDIHVPFKASLAKTFWGCNLWLRLPFSHQKSLCNSCATGHQIDLNGDPIYCISKDKHCYNATILEVNYLVRNVLVFLNTIFDGLRRKLFFQMRCVKRSCCISH